MKELLCPICRSHLEVPTRRGWRVRRCLSCGFQLGETAFRFQFGSKRHSYFDNSDYVDFRVQAREFFERLAQRRFDDLEESGALEGVIDIVEIGCSTGEFLDAANRSGYKVVGHDEADNAVQAAIGNYGVDATSDLGDLPQQGFDVACAFHVIEHVEDPVSFVEAISGLLRPNGILYLRMPHIGSLASSLLMSNWPGLSIEHVNFFDRRSLEKTLERTGYQLLNFATESHPRFLAGGFRRLLKGGSRPYGRSNPGSNSTPSRRELKIMNFLSYPYTPASVVERLLNRGDEMVVIARLKS